MEAFMLPSQTTLRGATSQSSSLSQAVPPARAETPTSSRSGVIVGTCAALGASVALVQRTRSLARRSNATEKEAFDVWQPSTYGNISMDDVKKYGAAGTLSYVITELIFWALAFPTEVFIYLQTAGHWPDFSKPEESAAVFGMVFAASNVARLLLPVRFGAALAMAPWVDENIMKRFSSESEQAATVPVPVPVPVRATSSEPAKEQTGQLRFESTKEQTSELREYLMQS